MSRRQILEITFKSDCRSRKDEDLRTARASVHGHPRYNPGHDYFDDEICVITVHVFGGASGTIQ